MINVLYTSLILQCSLGLHSTVMHVAMAHNNYIYVYIYIYIYKILNRETAETASYITLSSLGASWCLISSITPPLCVQQIAQAYNEPITKELREGYPPGTVGYSSLSASNAEK